MVNSQQLAYTSETLHKYNTNLDTGSKVCLLSLSRCFLLSVPRFSHNILPELGHTPMNINPSVLFRDLSATNGTRTVY